MAWGVFKTQSSALSPDSVHQLGLGFCQGPLEPRLDVCIRLSDNLSQEPMQLNELHYKPSWELASQDRHSGVGLGCAMNLFRPAAR